MLTAMRIVVLLLAALLWPRPTSAEDPFYLKDNDVVVFYGDSITDQRMYTTFVETFVVTRYPRLNVKFVHSGWGGDRVTGGGGGTVDERLARDVIAYKPTVMTVMLGMNDGRYRKFDDEIYQTYTSGFEHIVEAVKSAFPGLRLTLIKPSPYDDVTRPPTFSGGYNQVLVRYGEFVAGLGARSGAAVADLNTGVVEMLRKANTIDSETAKRIIPDRVHPGWGGHMVMATELLRAWGARPEVSAVRIDASTGQVSSEHTKVTDWNSAGSYSWTQVDEALPMPAPAIDPAVSLAMKASRFTESWNRETLAVTGLPSGRYTLKINGLPIGEFAGEQLAAGLDLTEFDTPMMRQAREAHGLTMKRASVHQTRWRQLQVPLEKDGLPRLAMVLDSLDGLDADLLARQHDAAQPAACFYELVSVASRSTL